MNHHTPASQAIILTGKADEYSMLALQHLILEPTPLENPETEADKINADAVRNSPASMANLVWRNRLFVSFLFPALDEAERAQIERLLHLSDRCRIAKHEGGEAVELQQWEATRKIVNSYEPRLTAAQVAILDSPNFTTDAPLAIEP